MTNLQAGLESLTLDRLKSILFFLGKGGVGKTTLSVNFAIYLSKNGFKTYLMSVDPAHNIADLLETKLHNGPNKINSNLVIEELDVDLHLKKTIKKTGETLKEQYKYLQILNLDNMFNVIKYSPGLQEYSIMYGLFETYNRVLPDFDCLIIDTPPTGLMMRIFSLPQTNLMWLDKLKELRSNILGKRDQIAHFDKGTFKKHKIPTRESDDMVFKKLQFEIKRTQDIGCIYKSDISKKILVMNDDRLSLLESFKILNDLKSFNMGVDSIAINKNITSDLSLSEIKEDYSKLKDYKNLLIPFYKSKITEDLMLPHMQKMFNHLDICK